MICSVEYQHAGAGAADAGSDNSAEALDLSAEAVPADALVAAATTAAGSYNQIAEVMYYAFQ